MSDTTTHAGRPATPSRPMSINHAQPARVPLIARLMRAYMNSNVKGQTRIAPGLTAFIARFMPSMHAVPIQIADWPPVYMDLRVNGGAWWLRWSPTESSWREPDEQDIMRAFV